MHSFSPAVVILELSLIPRSSSSSLKQEDVVDAGGNIKAAAAAASEVAKSEKNDNAGNGDGSGDDEDGTKPLLAEAVDTNGDVMPEGEDSGGGESWFPSIL
jgi:hypothetical protein